jgi:hypothetical protein
MHSVSVQSRIRHHDPVGSGQQNSHGRTHGSVIDMGRSADRPWPAVAWCLVVACAATGCRSGSSDEQSADQTVAPSLTVFVSASQDGSVRVTETVHAKNSDFNVEITRPHAGAVAGLNFAPEVRDLILRVSGTEANSVARLTEDVTFYFATPVDSATLTYDVAGATRESRPSKPGRHLLLYRGLETSLAEDLPRQVTVAGALNLACSERGLVFMPCGHSTERGWTVALPAGRADDLVLAQVDMS